MSSSKSTFPHIIIKLMEYQLSNPNNKHSQPCIYYSFSLNNIIPSIHKQKNQQSLQQQAQPCQYFTSRMPQNSNSVVLTDDIIVSAPNGTNTSLNIFDLCQSMVLKRWENHMVMFSIDIDIQELRTRPVICKKVQTKSGQRLKLMLISIKNNQIRFGNQYIQSITQHYLIINSLAINNTNNNEQKQRKDGASYLQVKCQSLNYIVPVVDGQITVKIPQNIQFYNIKNGRQISKSCIYQSAQLNMQKMNIQMQPMSGNKNSQLLSINLKWGINFLQNRPQSTLLLESQQINIYDIQIKIDNTDNNLKAKLIYANKAFQLGSQFSNAKGSNNKIRKIINFIAKSDEQQIIVFIQKNLKVVAQVRVQIQEITAFTVNSVKRKINDLAGKPYGSLKFKCQKAKNLSTPNNNKFWRDSLKNSKSVSNILLIINQLSIKYQIDKQIILVLKTQSEQKIIKKLPNFQFFDSIIQVSQSAYSFNLKQDESIYMVLKQINSGENDFVGIAVFNPATVCLGQSLVQIKFFKNQNQTIILNCQINKIPAYPFIKPSFQPQLLQILSHNSVSMSVVLRQIQFSSYFYTFRYDNKNQVYSIVEVNRHKKVLILQNKNKANQLSFNCSASSDNLDFCVQQAQTFKIKITFLVSDLGQDQQIYGWSIVKFKNTQFQAASPFLKFYLVEIKNDFGSNLGQINLEIHKAQLFNSHMKQSRDILQSSSRAAEGDKRKIKMHLAQISQSVQLKQKQKNFQPIKNVQTKQLNSKKNNIQQSIPQLKKPSLRYEKAILGLQQKKRRNNSVMEIQKKLKLPAIRQQSASPPKKNYNQLVQMMKIRRRSTKGHYQQNSMLQSYQIKDYNNRSVLKSGYKFDDSPGIQTFHLKQKIQKQNPNLSRNMQILFPKKSARMQKNSSLVKRPISQQQSKLKGLKSVMNQISSDLNEIQPTVKDSQVEIKKQSSAQKIHYSNDVQSQHFKGPQWADNQFI